MTKHSEDEEQRRPLNQMRVSILRDMNSFLASVDREADIPGLHVYFSGNGYSMQLYGLFLNRGVCEMLEGKNYRAVNMVFLNKGAYIDGATRFQYDRNWTGVHRICSNIVSKVMSRNCDQGWSVEELGKLRWDVYAFKHMIVNILRLAAHLH